jgi:S1-C subfamily serine protease
MFRLYILLSLFLLASASYAQEDSVKNQPTPEEIEIKVNLITENIQKQVDSLLKALGITNTDSIEINSWMPERMENDHPFLGIVFESVDTADGNPAGVIVMKVVEGSAAQLAGLEEGDIIFSFDNRDVTGIEDIVTSIKEKKIGDEVAIKYYRDEKVLSGTAKLQPRVDPNMYGNLFTPRQMDPSQCETKGPLFGYMQHSRPRLGIQITDLDEEMSRDLKIKKEKGALITQVEAGSPAEEMGLKLNDVITGINGREVNDTKDLVEAISETKIGDMLDISYIRYGKKKETNGELSAFSGGWEPQNKYRVFKLDDIENLNGQELRDELEQLKDRLESLEEEIRSKGQ